MIVGRFPVLSETFVLNQVTGLIDRGHEVDIYTEAPGETAKMHPNVEKYQLLERTQCMGMPQNRLLRLLKGIWLFSINYPKNPALLMQSLNVFKYGKEAASLRLLYAAVSVLPFLDEGTYDIIHCQFGTFGFLGIAFRIMAAPKGKLVVSFRGYDITWYLQWAGEHVYDRLFKVVDVFLPNCDYFKQRLIELGAEEKKIVIMRSGIDCSKFIFNTRHLPPDGRIRIVTTGRLVEKKGLEYGIRAVAKSTKLHPNIEYNIIGDGSLKEDLQQLIQELDVGDVVNLLGWKQQQEVVQILNDSQIFVAPCVTSKDNDQEGVPNVLKEAMAMGLPVVSTHHSGIPELVEDGISGFLVAERDVNALAAKLGYLIAHPEVWPEMGAAGRAYVEKHYEIEQLNDDLVEIYEKLLITR
jgi:colanic acid/amylovoran biosynthesis glycosyltransferase